MLDHVGGEFVKFVVSPNSSIELPGVKAPLRFQFGELLLPGREIYFHRNSVLGGEFPRLKVNSRVTYAEEMGKKGPQASTVKLIEKHKLRI